MAQLFLTEKEGRAWGLLPPKRKKVIDFYKIHKKTFYGLLGAVGSGLAWLAAQNLRHYF